ncbi:TPA: anti-phage dCTP deaminase [Pseudomonas aeruginosa]|nr:dCMP deaminase family protein [Pseudomonas aeruginosa]
MRFIGAFEDLKLKLSSLEELGEWSQLNGNQYQFRTMSRGILNWYPSTGGFFFQGRTEPMEQLKRLVGEILDADDEGPPSIEEKAEIDAAFDALSVEDDSIQESYLNDSYSDSELVIGLVGSVGTDLRSVSGIIEDRLKAFSYTCRVVKVSSDVIDEMVEVKLPPNGGEYERISTYMTEGNSLRKKYKDRSILALGAAAKINQIREGAALRRNAFIISSLKTPYEVQRLRKIYSQGFFLIGVHADLARRRKYLMDDLRMSEEKASNLIMRDADEDDPDGQHTRDTYHLSDFFVNYDGSGDSLKAQLWRVIDILFGQPYVTPTFDEYAMFMAFSASLRSADLSRQVGAVLTRDEGIISTGANDVPKAGGGLYWPELDPESHKVVDIKDGRDYCRGVDSNAAQKSLIVDDILEKVPAEYRSTLAPILKKSRIKDITEYGRVVHAEMEALLSAARAGVSPKSATLYCTTFPCHNCAKHIIAAGIKRVVYVEPYPKSKAQEFHSDSISLKKDGDGVFFDPFIGVGPRSFFNLFSTNLGSGYPITRKTDDGQKVDWMEADAKLRTQMLPCSYMERERIAGSLLSRYLNGDGDER